MLSVIIVDYNSIDKTLEYIDKLSGKISSNSEVHYIIVDNYGDSGLRLEQSSNPGIEPTAEPTANPAAEPTPVSFEGRTALVYTYKDTKIVYISSGSNAGYARGNNLGMRFSKEYFGDEYYLVSNNDIDIPENIDLSKITDIFDKNPDIAVIGPHVVGLDGEPQSPCVRPSAFGNLVMWYLSMATHDRLFKWNDVDYTGESKKCYRVMGSFMFLRAKALHEVELFDENTFMFAEEMILSERLLRHDYHVFFYDDLTVVHAHGESIGKVGDPTIPIGWTFESLCYYFENYRRTPKIMIFLGKLANRAYITLYKKTHTS